MTNEYSDIARLTAELADLQKRYPSSTAQTGLVLMKRIVKIKRKLISMGAARERVANITLVGHGGAVVTERYNIFDNPYDLDQYRLTALANAALAGAGYSNARIIRWSWAD